MERSKKEVDFHKKQGETPRKFFERIEELAFERIEKKKFEPKKYKRRCQE